MAEVQHMANVPVPLAERPTRIAAVERDIEEMSLIEEALMEAAAGCARPSLSVGAACGGARRQDRGTCHTRRVTLTRRASISLNFASAGTANLIHAPSPRSEFSPA